MSVQPHKICDMQTSKFGGLVFLNYNCQCSKEIAAHCRQWMSNHEMAKIGAPLKLKVNFNDNRLGDSIFMYDK